MEALVVVNPVATPVAHTAAATTFQPAPRLPNLDGRRIGLFWNGKNHGDVALARVRDGLSKLFGDVEFNDYLGDKGGMTRFATDGLRERIARECDAVVGTTADCGSCTSWLVRDMAEFERLGVPTVALVASGFAKDARWSSEVFGCPELAFAEVPLPFTNRDPAAIDAMVDDAIARIVAALTTQLDAEPLADSAFANLDIPTESELRYEGTDLLDCSDVMNRAFSASRWSDGLPLVPPTRAKVDAMIAASGRDADEVLGTFAPGMGLGTIEKIAANAVMAGAPPEAMPVIIAMA